MLWQAKRVIATHHQLPAPCLAGRQVLPRRFLGVHPELAVRAFNNRVPLTRLQPINPFIPPGNGLECTAVGLGQGQLNRCGRGCNSFRCD